MQSYSYFEQEGDQQQQVEQVLLEDEIWTRIRIDHGRLPVGKIKILPGLFHSRMKHKSIQAHKATASLEEKGHVLSYQLVYDKGGRSLKIDFGKDFPHQILSWEERSAGIGGKILTTKASLDKSLMTDYWSRNRPSDIYLRDSLNLN